MNSPSSFLKIGKVVKMRFYDDTMATTENT